MNRLRRLSTLAVDSIVALVLGVIGVTEKGTTSLELVAEGRGGHASTPARNGPTARIARAIACAAATVVT